jgi:hypothetical protein
MSRSTNLAWRGGSCSFIRYPPTTDLNEHLYTVLRFEKYLEANGILTSSAYKSSLPIAEQGVHLVVPAAIDLLHRFVAGAHFYELPFFKITNFPKFSFASPGTTPDTHLLVFCLAHGGRASGRYRKRSYLQRLLCTLARTKSIFRHF